MMNYTLRNGCLAITLSILLSPLTASAEITWWFDFAGSNPVNVPANKLAAITEAMDTAVEFYNAYSDYSLNEYSNDGIGLRVIYNQNVATANAGYKGRIAFGGKINDWTAMHEMSHVFGVGTIGAWNQNRNTSTNKWTSPIALAELEDIEGSPSSLNADSKHFWPHGLNTQDGNRHANVRLVGALREDMGLSNKTFTFDHSDFNRDGNHDGADLQIFKENWLSTNDGFGNYSFELGDRNLDGVTDLADWVMIRQDFANFGSGPFLEAFSFPVPEPSSLLLLMAASGLALGTRSKRGHRCHRSTEDSTRSRESTILTN